MFGALHLILQQFYQLIKNRQGVAAVEFALLLPVLLILVIGMAETTDALNHDRKVSQVASTIADLVAQGQIVSPTELSDYFLGAEAIMEPYPTTTLDIIVASVTFDADGDPVVDWSEDNDGGSPWPAGGPPPITLPATIRVPGASVVVGDASYTYTPMFASSLQSIFPRASSMNFSETFFLRPRLVQTVLCPAC
ncbi:MAG: pilus assembly protein [Roseibium sp.]|nr:pilus assembly protein [Roseibium sp.]